MAARVSSRAMPRLRACSVTYTLRIRPSGPHPAAPSRGMPGAIVRTAAPTGTPADSAIQPNTHGSGAASSRAKNATHAEAYASASAGETGPSSSICWAARIRPRTAASASTAARIVRSGPAKGRSFIGVESPGVTTK